MLMAFFSWWYGPGWLGQAASLQKRLGGVSDYFSIRLLLKTLFAPFRQISAGQVRGSLNVQFRAFIDRLISRLIGAFVRTGMIIIGCLAILVYSFLGTVTVLAWAIVPFAPIIGLALAFNGWLPWR